MNRSPYFKVYSLNFIIIIFVRISYFLHKGGITSKLQSKTVSCPVTLLNKLTFLRSFEFNLKLHLQSCSNLFRLDFHFLFHVNVHKLLARYFSIRCFLINKYWLLWLEEPMSLRIKVSFKNWNAFHQRSSCFDRIFNAMSPSNVANILDSDRLPSHLNVFIKQTTEF